MRALARFCLVLLLTAGLQTPVPAQTAAAGFPSHTLHLIVPYPAGGTVDLVARHLATALRPQLARDVVVENLAGAGGAIGLQRVLGGAADGHELALGTDSDAILVPLVNSDVKYRPAQWRLLGVVNQAPLVLVAGSAQTAVDLKTLIALARAAHAAGKPLSIGSYGVGSNAHLCAEDFAQRAELPLLHVPYKGIAALMQDLMGGHVDLAFLPLVGGVADTVAAGKLRALALAAPERHPRFPALPTVGQASTLNGFAHASWSGLMLPASAPEAAVTRLHKALQDSLRDAGFRQAMEQAGSPAAAPMSLVQAQQHFDAQVEVYRALLAQLQVRGVLLQR